MNIWQITFNIYNFTITHFYFLFLFPWYWWHLCPMDLFLPDYEGLELGSYHIWHIINTACSFLPSFHLNKISNNQTSCNQWLGYTSNVLTHSSVHLSVCLSVYAVIIICFLYSILARKNKGVLCVVPITPAPLCPMKFPFGAPLQLSECPIKNTQLLIIPSQWRGVTFMKPHPDYLR